MKSDNMQKTDQADQTDKQETTRNFANAMRGIFFLVSAVSLVVAMIMFVFVWQPIWVKGFNDFHTISESIDNLNKTATPASQVAPLMLEEMQAMSKTMKNMEATMQAMYASMQTLEAMPTQMAGMNDELNRLDYNMVNNLEQVNATMDSLNTSVRRITYLMDQLEENTSPAGMMPFNW